MELIILGVYSFIVWLIFQIVTMIFLTKVFLYQFNLIKFILLIILGIFISCFLVLILSKMKFRKKWLILCVSGILFLIEVFSTLFVLNFFNCFHLFLSNFLYSFIIISSLNERNLL